MLRSKNHSLLLLLILFLIQPLASCKDRKSENTESTSEVAVLGTSAGVSSKMQYSNAEVAMDAEEPRSEEVVEQVLVSPTNAPTAPTQSADTSRRMLDRDGTLDIQVRTYQPALDSVRMLVKSWGGFVESVNESNSDSGRTRSANLALRVPSKGFDEAMRMISRLGLYVNSRSENVTDVTREYHDNLARLKTRKILEERFQNLLKQAKNVRDVMQIERELNNIRYEIEAAESQKRATEFEVNMSQINLTLNYEKRRSEVVSPPGNGLFSRIGRSLGRAMDNVGDIFLWIVEVLPAALIVIALLALPIWWWRRRRLIKK